MINPVSSMLNKVWEVNLLHFGQVMIEKLTERIDNVVISALSFFH
jgi:hypothetical protein